MVSSTIDDAACRSYGMSPSLRRRAFSEALGVQEIETRDHSGESQRCETCDRENYEQADVHNCSAPGIRSPVVVRHADREYERYKNRSAEWTLNVAISGIDYAPDEEQNDQGYPVNNWAYHPRGFRYSFPVRCVKPPVRFIHSSDTCVEQQDRKEVNMGASHGSRLMCSFRLPVREPLEQIDGIDLESLRNLARHVRRRSRLRSTGRMPSGGSCSTSSRPRGRRPRR